MCSATRVLIIDDDRELCELLGDYLTCAGFTVDAAGEADQGLQRAMTGDYDAAVLDVVLPAADGFDVLRRIRAQSGLPVLMLTARGEETDRVVGLEIGADDYLSKPFSPRELAARLRAIVRRTKPDPHTTGPGHEPEIVLGDLRIDPATRTVEWAGESVEVTSTEFDILAALVRCAGRVVSRGELSRTALGRRLFPEDRAIDMHISNLRRKLVACSGATQRIKTLRGSGYAWVLSAPPRGDS